MKSSSSRHHYRMVGTPYFMAPEVSSHLFVFSLFQVISQQKYGQPSDIWGIGCIAFELACSMPPRYNLGRTQVPSPLKTLEFPHDQAMWVTVTKGGPILPPRLVSTQENYVDEYVADLEYSSPSSVGTSNSFEGLSWTTASIKIQSFVRLRWNSFLILFSNFLLHLNVVWMRRWRLYFWEHLFDRVDSFSSKEDSFERFNDVD